MDVQGIRKIIEFSDIAECEQHEPLCCTDWSASDEGKITERVFWLCKNCGVSLDSVDEGKD